MRLIILLPLFVYFNSSFAQTQTDTNNISVAVTTYLLPGNSIYPDGCAAIGPSFFFNDGKFSLQAGFLYDLQQFYIYERRRDIHSRKKVSKSHLIFPVALHYTFYSMNKIDFILSGGLF